MIRPAPVIELVQRDTIRLIPTGRLKDPALLPLAGDEQALADLESLEGVTSGRLRAEEAGLPDLDPRELVFGRAHATIINAAFTHVRPGGNRFNDERRGAWYCAFEAETALAEVGHHLTRELDAIGRLDNVTDYSEFLADFIGGFHDLRGCDASEPVLHSDSAIAYGAGQRLARGLRMQSASNGIVYPSVRNPGGTCLVAFRPDLVQNVRQGGTWRMEWRGSSMPAVSRQS